MLNRVLKCVATMLHKKPRTYSDPDYHLEFYLVLAESKAVRNHFLENAPATWIRMTAETLQSRAVDRGTYVLVDEAVNVGNIMAQRALCNRFSPKCIHLIVLNDEKFKTKVNSSASVQFTNVFYYNHEDWDSVNDFIEFVI